MSWLYYLLEANLYLVVFFAFYLLALRRETFYNRNRFYLIGTSLISFLIPLLQVGFLKPEEVIEQVNYETAMVYQTDVYTLPLAKPETDLTFNDFILPVYLLIAFILAIKLVLSIAKIISIYKNAQKQKTANATVVELKGEHTAFSFFNLLFINPALPKKELIFKHELIHIEQKHSWDVLFFELLQIVNWFNPIVYFLKKEVKVLHEYIADELATPDISTKHEYAMVLIENSLQFKSHALTHQFFNQTILKNRIMMMNKEKTKNWARLKILLALPLAGGMLCLSTMAFTKDYGYDLLPQKKELKVESKNLQDPIKQTNAIGYFPSYKYVNKTYISLEKRAIVINGKLISEKNKYYGTREADKVIYLKKEEAVKKYGEKGKYGAVEIIGEKAVNVFPPPRVSKNNVQQPQVEQVKFPPPIVKQDKVKFPPPIVRKGGAKNSRVVWTSQQLVPTNIKSNRMNKDSVNYTEQLKDCFQIIEYDQRGKHKIALDWTLCPSGKCPKTGTFNKGTAEYEKLGTLISTSTSINDIKFPPPIIKTD